MTPFILSRLLIIEDDPNTLAGLQELLQDEGFYVCGATNGRKALEAGNRETFDIVLCDYCLPGMDGLEVCHALKRMQPHLTLFLVTAHHHIELDNAAEQYGIAKVIVKPIIFSDLLDALFAAAAGSRKYSGYTADENAGPSAASIFA
jgi:DNA-binding NtrC family response regulator